VRLALALLILFSGCVTTSEMLRKREYKDPTKIVTVDDDAHAFEKTLKDKSREELLRDYIVLKNQLEEKNRDLELYKEKSKIIERAQPVSLELVGELENPAKRVENLKGPDLLWQSIVNLIHEKKYSEALPLLRQLAKSYPKYKKRYISFVLVGMLEYNLKNYKEAIFAFNHIIDNFPQYKSTSIAWQGSAFSFKRLGRYQEGELFYSELLKRFPDSPQAIEAKKIELKKTKTPENLFEHYADWWQRAIN